MSIAENMIERARKHWKSILLFVGVTSVLDILKEFLRAKFMEWGVSHLGWLGTWFMENPAGTFTLAVVCVLGYLLFSSLTSDASHPHVSRLVDSSDQPLISEGSTKRTVTNALVVALVFLVVAGGFIKYYIATKTEKGRLHTVTITMPPQGWLVEWGAGNPTTTMPFAAKAVANTSSIMPYRKHFRLMLICRINNPAIDQMQDTTISKSTTFSIPESYPFLAMEMPLDGNALVASTPNQNGVYGINMQMALILLSESSEPQKITKLGDVEADGGKILTVNGFPLTITKKLVAVPLAVVPETKL